MTSAFCHWLKKVLNKIQDGDRGDGSIGKTLCYANIRPSPTSLGDIKEERTENNIRTRGWERML